MENKDFIIEFAREDEFDEIRKIADRVFGGEGNTDFFENYHPKLYVARNTAERHLVLRENGEIKAFVGIFPAEMEILGRRLKICGIGTMSVVPDARNRGCMSAVMKRAVEICDSQADITFLGGRRQRYELFGITPAGVSASFLFNSDNARHVYGGKSFGFEFREIVEPDDVAIETFMKLYERRPARVVRPKELFYYSLRSCRMHAYSVERNGKTVGYFTTNFDGSVIHEFELEDVNLLGEMLCDFLSFSERNSIGIECVYMFEREKLKILGNACEGMNIRACESFRINNYAKVTEAFLALKSSYEELPDLSFSYEVKQQSGGKQGVLLEIKNGSFTVQKFDGETELSLEPIEAARLLFGAAGLIDCDGKTLSPQCRALFPLPLFYTRPDFV